jgi:molybdenum cofactor biosynthesis enzyme MoaA
MEKSYRIMIETSNICNARCEFCPNPTLIREKMIMTDEIFELIIRRIQEEKIRVEKFILHLNGEPLTDIKLVKRIKRLKEKFPEVPVWFTTNFSLANKKLINELVCSGIDTITVSINSVDKDQYHKIMGLELDKTLYNLHYLLETNSCYGLPVNVRTSIVDTGNKESLKQFKDMFSGKCDIRIIHLGQWIGKEIPDSLNKNANVKNSICDDLNRQICILSNGDYAICSFDAEGNAGKNVSETALLEAFYSYVYIKLRKSHVENGRKGTLCENCSFSF